MKRGWLGVGGRSTAERFLAVFLTAWLLFGAPVLSAVTFYVNATTGSDGNSAIQAQSGASPWKSITKAIGDPAVMPGDTIQVMPGLYDTVGNGETFPLMLVDGVAILGNISDPTLTTISAPAGTHAFFNNGGSLSASTRLAGFTLTHDTQTADDRLVFINMQTSDIQSPRIDHNRFLSDDDDEDRGVYFEDDSTGPGEFTGIIEDNEFDTVWAAVWGLVNEPGANVMSPLVRNNTFTNCDYPLNFTASSSAAGTIAPMVTGNRTTGTTEADIFLWVETNEDGLMFSPTVTGNSFTGEGSGFFAVAYGDLSSAESLTITPTIENNTFSGHTNGGYFYFYASWGSGNVNADVSVSNNTFTDSGGIQFYNTGADSGVDFENTVNFNGNRFIGGEFSAIYFEAELVNGASDFDVTYNANGNYINKEASFLSDAITFNLQDVRADPEDSFTLNAIGNLVRGGDPDDPNTIGFAEGIFILMEYPTNYDSFSATLRGNTLTRLIEDGIDLDLSGLFEGGSADVQIRDNHMSENGLAGLDVLWFDPNEVIAEPITVRCNTFTSNDFPGVYLPGYLGAEPNFGTDPNDPGLNSFVGNDIFFGPYELYTDEANPILAQGNWWGTTTGIDDLIRDDNEDGGAGAVDFSNFLTSAPTTTVVDDMMLTLIDDVDPVGPSMGDTLRVTVTLDASGTCTGAFYHYEGPIPANSTYVQDSLTTTDGYPIQPLPWTNDPVFVQGIEIPPGGSATITYDVIAGEGMELTTDGSVESGNIGNQAVGPASVELATASIPTVGEWGMIVLSLMLIMTSLVVIRRRERVARRSD